MKQRFCISLVLGCLAAAGSARAEVPRVLASIAPIHSLTAAVMAGIGEPELLVPGNASDHDYALRPSDLRKIAGADLVVWVGSSLETYLEKPLRTEGVAALTILEVPGAEPRPYANQEQGPGPGSDGDVFTADGAEAAGDGHERRRDPQDSPEPQPEEGDEPCRDTLGLDPNVWLDPIRAQAILRAIATRLGEVDEDNAEAYRRNAEAAAAELQALDGEIRRTLAPVATKPFITFHDGYAYFVERYGLNQVGQLSVEPEQQAGAASVRALRDLVAGQGVACAFAEPQFDATAVEDLAGDAEIRVGELDAIGADLEPGAALYGVLLRKNAVAVAECLASTS